MYFNIGRIWRDITPDPYSLIFLIVISFLIANHTVFAMNRKESFFGHIQTVLFWWFVGVVLAGIVFFIILVIANIYGYGSVF